MALVAPDGKWLKVNRALCNMLGYSAYEMKDMSFKDITHPEDWTGGIQFLKEAMNPNVNFYRTEKRYISKSGAQIWVNLNVSSVRDAKGRLQYFVTQTEDITEKKKITELLQVREQQLRLFIEHSPAALAMFDMDMRYIITSKRWLSDYGLEGKEVIGKIHYDLFPNNPQRWRDIHQQSLKGAVAKSDEDFYINESGKAEWLKWEVHPWKQYDGEIGGIILFTEVITRIKEAELKFRNLVEQSLVGVCIVQDEKFAYVNPRLADIYGYSPQEMINTFPAKMVFDEEYRHWCGSYKEGVPIHFEAKGQRKDGRPIFLEAYGTVTTYEGRAAVLWTLLDITERKKADELIMNAEEKRRMIMDAALDAIVSIDGTGAVIAWNPHATKIFGWSEQEVLGKPLTDTIIPPQYRERHIRGIERYLKTGEGSFLHRLIELSAVNRAGHEFPVELTIIPIIQKDEVSFTAFIRDISERKEAQEKLEESEEKFRNLVEKSLAGVYIIQDGKARYINPAHQKIMGYSLAELQALENVESLVYDGDAAVYRAYHQVGRATDATPAQYGLRAIRKDGAIVYLEITTSEIIYEGKPALIGTMLDVTDRAEEEIRIARAVNEAQEKERMQIGMELHDNVKQILAASMLRIDFVKSHLADVKLATENLMSLKRYTKEAIDELRRLSHQLAPAVESTNSFSDQVEKLISTINTGNELLITAEIPADDNLFPAEVRTAFYRILQEQLNNIIKHAHATSVLIAVESTGKDLVLMIRDNGRGFDATLRSDGIGLENIKRRAFVLGGTAKIISSPGNGCEVRVSIPANW
jgi:PAS domain S-box-containing protein